MIRVLGLKFTIFGYLGKRPISVYRSDIDNAINQVISSLLRMKDNLPSGK